MALAPPPHIIYNNFSGQFNIAFVSITSQPNSKLNNNKLLLLTQKHTTFAFAVSALLNILQLKYNGSTTESPFVAHPIIMGIAVTAVLLYCLACDAELRICSRNTCRPASNNNNNANATNIIHHVVRLLVSVFSLGACIPIFYASTGFFSFRLVFSFVAAAAAALGPQQNFDWKTE